MWWENTKKDCWKTAVGKVGNDTCLRTADEICETFKECVISKMKKHILLAH